MFLNIKSLSNQTLLFEYAYSIKDLLLNQNQQQQCKYTVIELEQEILRRMEFGDKNV